MLTMQVIGNVGKDPEFKETNNGLKLCNLTLASNKKVKGEKVTTWVGVTIFDERKIDFVRSYVRKGTKLFLEGEPAARAWVKDGEAKSSLEMTLGFGSKIEICSSDRADSPASTQGNAASGQGGGSDWGAGSGWNDDLGNDDIPF